MLMGNSTFKRRFGVYQSANPIINMSNALQQMHTLNKAKTEMSLMLFDDMLSISTGIIAISCSASAKVYKDILIYRKGYRLTELDRRFIAAVSNLTLR